MAFLNEIILFELKIYLCQACKEKEHLKRCLVSAPFLQRQCLHLTISVSTEQVSLWADIDSPFAFVLGQAKKMVLHKRYYDE